MQTDLSACSVVLVDFNDVVYEYPNGTPVLPFLLSAGDSVVLKGIRVPAPAESTLPAVQATIVEMAVPSTASSTATN